MIEDGEYNRTFGAGRFGFRELTALHWNLGAPQLYEHALQRHEAHIAEHGPLVADTGVHTGRSPKDKFVVRDAETDPIVWWDNNNAMSVENFDSLFADFLAHAEGKALYAQDLYAGAEPALRVRARVFTEYAWHSLFIRNLLIRPPREDLAGFRPRPDDRRPAFVPRRSEATWRAQRNSDRLRFHPQDRADRRHQLRRRDQEVGLHLSSTTCCPSEM